MLGKEMLSLPGVHFLLSEKFNQDPLEQYFSKQRGMGGFCDNPTVRQFQHNALRLQVSGAPSVLAGGTAKFFIMDNLMHQHCKGGNIIDNNLNTRMTTVAVYFSIDYNSTL